MLVANYAWMAMNRSNSQNTLCIVDFCVETKLVLNHKIHTHTHSLSPLLQALQDKYTSIVVVGQQLETQILELRGRPAHHKKKYVTRHQRSNSHPAVVVPRTTTTANRTHHSNTNSPSLSHRH